MSHMVSASCAALTCPSTRELHLSYFNSDNSIVYVSDCHLTICALTIGELETGGTSW